MKRILALFPFLLFSFAAIAQQPGDGIRKVFPNNTTQTINRQLYYGFSRLLSANYDSISVYYPGDRTFWAGKDWQATDTIPACTVSGACTYKPGISDLWICLTCPSDGGGGVDLSGYVQTVFLNTSLGSQIEDTPLTVWNFRADPSSPSGYYLSLAIDTVAADARWGGGGSSYVLPTMSASVRGGAKVGKGLVMAGDTLNILAVSTNFIYLSPDGNDGTGQRGNIGAPFASIAAAKAVYTAGDVITVNPGVYTGQDNLQIGGEEPVYYFAPGATVTFTDFIAGVGAGNKVTIRGSGHLSGRMYGDMGSEIDAEFDEINATDFINTGTTTTGSVGRYKGRRLTISGTWATTNSSRVTYEVETINHTGSTTTFADYAEVQFSNSNITTGVAFTVYEATAIPFNYSVMEFHNSVLNATTFTTATGVGSANSFSGRVLFDHTTLNTTLDGIVFLKFSHNFPNISQIQFNAAIINAGAGHYAMNALYPSSGPAGTGTQFDVPYLKILSGGLKMNAGVIHHASRPLTSLVPFTNALKDSTNTVTPFISALTGITVTGEPVYTTAKGTAGQVPIYNSDGTTTPGAPSGGGGSTTANPLTKGNGIAYSSGTTFNGASPITISTDTSIIVSKAFGNARYALIGSGGGTWGSIVGTLSSQSDLNTALSGKVPTTTTVNGHALSSNVTVTTAGTANRIVVTNGTTDPTIDISSTFEGLLTKNANNLSDLANAGTARTNLGLGTLATQGGTFSGISSGTNTGDQTITLTGNVTGSGTGSFPTTIVSIPSAATATTQSPGDNSTKVSTTAYVDAAVTAIGAVTASSVTTFTNKSISGSTNTFTNIPLTTAVTGTLPVANGGTGTTTSTGTTNVVLSNAPTLTNPVVGTQTPGDNSTKAASTAYTDAAVALVGSVRVTITQSAHGFTAGKVLTHSGGVWAVADNTANSTASVIGVVESVTTNTFVLVKNGGTITLSGLTADTDYFLGTSGGYTTPEPNTIGVVSKPIFRATSTTTAEVIIQRGIIN